MKLTMGIDWDVEETSPEVKAMLEEVIGEETRGFAETIRRRLAAEGITDMTMTLREQA
jgi:hypothetical protein